MIMRQGLLSLKTYIHQKNPGNQPSRLLATKTGERATMEGNRCKFWLPKKNRFCANLPLNDSPSVLQENLESHVKRCPLLKQAQSLSLQPFYQKGINAGNEQEDNFTSEMKRAAVYAMTVSEFYGLIEKIEHVHASMCKNILESYKVPEACNVWIKGEVDRKLPFQEKHVVQQASILGNLEEIGVLSSSALREHSDQGGAFVHNPKCVPAVVEFGAGRGYLTQMLADCYGIEKVFLVERKSYKLKADRSLRQKESLILERLRIDIEDLNMKAVESLKGFPYLAIGKHLCGPATDLTLRCCLPEQCCENGVQDCDRNCFLEGLAIATCCHHLCQWKHYISIPLSCLAFSVLTYKKFMSELEITKEQFHAITWFTSWAVDADHSSDVSDIANSRLHPQSIEEEHYHGDANGIEGVVRSIKAVERAALGFKCKQIIDMGRMMWLKEHGMYARLVKYVASSISPENHLLLARHDNCS
ncbi:hypothetical protein Tsubulata_003493 [Turnera subulata]|uniref:tRNA:m(4)X modification enzyme TRM13 n=1 Tax=Turnera subulata TaxID=218843 RepID=A0A9Q0G7B9_9ROSI|nr:hypothetical protein Tsubulata_003493 [Turnera subulata]